MNKAKKRKAVEAAGDVASDGTALDAGITASITSY